MVLASLAALMEGCVAPTANVRREIEWPDEASTQLVVPAMEAGAALAAAAAIRELVKTQDDPRLFQGCSSPEQGLDVAVFKEPKSSLYFVVLHQRFDRCGGPRGRVLDWWYEYAVTAQGEVLAEAPPDSGEAPPSAPPLNAPVPAEQPPPADAPAPGTETPTGTPLPPPVPEILPSPAESAPPGSPEPLPPAAPP
jgi:hypothetical protein